MVAVLLMCLVSFKFQFVEIDRSAARFYNDLHTDIIWPMILVFTVAHIGAALFHQFIQKDKLINRIL